MSDQSKIEILEKKIQILENENSILKSMLKQQVTFGHKITVIVAEMDELLEKKKLEIDALTKQLLTQPPATKIKPMEDFSVNLGSEDLRVGFLEIQKWREIKKRESKSEFEQTEDGKFKYPFKPKKNQRYLQSRGNISPKPQKSYSEAYWRKIIFAIFAKEILIVKKAARNTC